MYLKNLSVVKGNGFSICCLLITGLWIFIVRDYPFYPSFSSTSFSDEQSTMEIVRLTAELATLGERASIALEPIWASGIVTNWS